VGFASLCLDTLWRTRGQERYDHSGRTLSLEALAEVGCGLTVAEETEGADVVEVALTSAFGHREDVVGVPQAAAGRDGFHSVEAEPCGSCGSARAFEGGVDGDGVAAADGTDTTVAGENLVAEISGICTESPLMDTVVATEGAPSLSENFELAPAAERQTVGAFGKRSASGVPALKCSRRMH
jgi:hypothetical protein